MMAPNVKASGVFACRFGDDQRMSQVSFAKPIVAPPRAGGFWSRQDFASISRSILQTAALLICAFGVYGSIRADRYSAEQWFDLFAFGLTLGGIYALIALGYTMVYGVLRLINFAHGDIMMVGAFSAYFLAYSFNRDGTFEASPVLALLAVVMLGAVISALVAYVVERLAYRPLRRSRGFAPLITSIGMSFVLEQSCRGMFGSGVKAYPDPAWLSGTIKWGRFSLPIIEIVVLVAAALAMLMLYLIVNRTKVGTAMRATAEDPQAAALMGIDVNRIIVVTFVLGGFMAGIGGVLYAFIYKQVYFLMGFLPGVKAFGAAVLGGIGNIPGAMIGGIFLGLFESLGPSLILDGLGVPAPYQLRDLIAFTLLILVLICRPQGLLGEKIARERA